MKKFLAFIAAIIALVAMPALACEFEGQRNFPVAPLFGDASATGNPVSVEKIADQFVSRPEIRAKFEAAGCTAAEMKGKIIALNGGNSAELMARSANFIFPTLKLLAPASAKPAPAASAAPQFTAQAVVQPLPVTTASAAPLPAPAAAPTAAPATPVVAAPLAVKPLPARVDMTDVWGAINALKADDEKLRAAIANKSPEQVTAQDRTVIKQLNAIPNWEEALKKLGATGEVETAKLPAEQQAVVQQVIAAKSLAESYLGRDTLDGMTVVNSIFTLLLVILAAFGIRAWRNRDKDIATAAQSAVDDALADVRLDDTFKLTTLARLAEVEDSVKNIGEQTGATDKVDLGQHQLDALAALPVGDELDTDVFVNNVTESVVRWKRTANDQLVIVTKGIVDYTDGTPIAKPEAFVRKAYKDGRLRLILSPLVLTQQAG